MPKLESYIFMYIFSFDGVQIENWVADDTRIDCRRDTLTLGLKIVKCMGFPWAIIGIIIGLDQLYQGKSGQYHFHDTA